MEFYPWVVFIHVASVVLMFFAHGASAAVALKLRTERDPARIAALLDLSGWSLGAAGVALLVVFVSGILAGIMGGWWGQLWIWAALVILVLVSGLMTPLGVGYLNEVRRAIGVPSPRDKNPGGPLGPTELEALLRSPKPVQMAALGVGGLLVILWLMMLKPF
jgi:hypothetical protein